MGLWRTEGISIFAMRPVFLIYFNKIYGLQNGRLYQKEYEVLNKLNYLTTKHTKDTKLCC
jgi:hypothetical protein